MTIKQQRESFFFLSGLHYSCIVLLYVCQCTFNSCFFASLVVVAVDGSCNKLVVNLIKYSDSSVSQINVDRDSVRIIFSRFGTG